MGPLRMSAIFQQTCRCVEESPDGTWIDLCDLPRCADLHGFSWFSSETLLEIQAPKAPEVSTDGAEAAVNWVADVSFMRTAGVVGPASRPSSWKCNLESFGWNAPVRKWFPSPTTWTI